MKSNHVLAGLAVVVLGGVLWVAMASLGTDGPAAQEMSPRPDRPVAEADEGVDLESSSEPEARSVPEWGKVEEDMF